MRPWLAAALAFAFFLACVAVALWIDWPYLT